MRKGTGFHYFRIRIIKIPTKQKGWTFVILDENNENSKSTKFVTFRYFIKIQMFLYFLYFYFFLYFCFFFDDE